MASVVDILNIGLHRLGLDDIASTTEQSQKARLTAACYDQKRQLMLEENVWTFATTRLNMALSSLTPALTSDFQYMFQLPSDYIRMVTTEFEERDYYIESVGNTKYVLFNNTTLGIRYIRDITDPNLMSAGFREALGLRIANEVCVQLTGSASLKTTIWREYMAIVASAATVDAQSNGEGLAPDDEWVIVRS